MILRRIARPRVVAKPFEQLSQSQSRLYQRQQCRSIHAVPPLGHNNQRGEYFAEHGVPGFLSSKTFRQTWEQYQGSLIQQINAVVSNTEYENKTPAEMHRDFSRYPDRADLYNIAAMAHFNHLWWESLSDEKTPIPEGIRKDIEETFQSVENLRNEMLEHGDAMFGNGFVWLLKENSQSSARLHTPLRILCTYNAGSPYASAYRMRQSVDQATGLDLSSRMKSVQNTAGGMGKFSQAGRLGSITSTQLDAYPLLCLNVWQHMYIPDYGILGKRTYMSTWWDRINWNVVADRYEMEKKSAGY